MPTLERRAAAFDIRQSALKKQFIERLVSGLRKQSIVSPSTWARQYRVLGSPFPGPFSFRRHPWQVEMHDSIADLNIAQKSSQMGISEMALNVTFFNMDIRGISCLYILPVSKPDASVFSASRFGPALESSPHLRNLFSDVNNIDLKRAGAVSLYIRGSRSRSQLKSIPCGFIVFDELDEMFQKNIPLAEERAAGQVISQIWKISTPTAPGYGINALFEKSTKEHFFFPCPSCSRHIDLQFPRNMVFPEEIGENLDSSEITSERLSAAILAQSSTDSIADVIYLKCHECDAKLPHEQKQQFLAPGKWVAQNKNGTGRGFYINHLYSSAKAGQPTQFITKYLQARIDSASEQEFWNSALGLAHTVKGGSVTEDMIKTAIGNYRQLASASEYQDRNPITMGVDVGRYFHIEVVSWDLANIPATASIGTMNHYARAKVIAQFKVVSPEQVKEAINLYAPRAVVIDAQPERRIVKEIADFFYGRVKLCIYGNIKGEIFKETGNDHIVVVDRTSWLDLSLGRFMRGTITLPANIDLEYREQLKAQSRVYDRGPDGNIHSKWVAGRDDHYGHARNYSEIALMFAAGASPTTLTSSPFSLAG